MPSGVHLPAGFLAEAGTVATHERVTRADGPGRIALEDPVEVLAAFQNSVAEGMREWANPVPWSRTDRVPGCRREHGPLTVGKLSPRETSSLTRRYLVGIATRDGDALRFMSVLSRSVAMSVNSAKSSTSSTRRRTSHRQ